MISNLEKRVSKLERVQNPSFIVWFPDKRCEHGEETYDNRPIPPGCRCVVNLSWRDVALA